MKGRNGGIFFKNIKKAESQPFFLTRDQTIKHVRNAVFIVG